MHRAVTVVIVALALVSACKKQRDDTSAAEAVDALTGLAERMCACTDRACVDEVQEQMIRWTTSVAPRAQAARSSVEGTRRLTEISERYALCMATLLAPAVAATAPATPAPPVDAGPARPAAIAAPARADQLLRAASDWPRAAERVKSLRFSYVDAEGILDAAHGRFEVRFALAPPIADDPARRTGLPVASVKDRPTNCEHLAWAPGTGWTDKWMTCAEVVAGPRCPVTEIWRRAIAAGAPTDAVAILDYSTASKPLWLVRISDPPRNVHFNRAFPDDCELVVEQPAP